MATHITKKQRQELGKLELMTFSEETRGRAPLPMGVRLRIADQSFYERYYGNPKLASQSSGLSSATIVTCWKVMEYEIHSRGMSDEAHAVGSNGFRRYH